MLRWKYVYVDCDVTVSNLLMLHLDILKLLDLLRESEVLLYNDGIGEMGLMYYFSILYDMENGCE